MQDLSGIFLSDGFATLNGLWLHQAGPTMKDPGCAILPFYFSGLRTANYEGFGEAPSPAPLPNGEQPRRQFAASALCPSPHRLKSAMLLFHLLLIPALAFPPVTVACAPD